MIDTETIRIEAFRINDRGHWELEEYKQLSKTLRIPTVEVDIALSEIYEGTKIE